MLSRPIDDLGRIVIPKEIRDFLNWHHKDLISITPLGRKIILGKLEYCCCICESDTMLVALPNGSMVCESCLRTISETARTHENSHLRR